MLVASICRERHFAAMNSGTSRVPRRCLFGSPSAKETAELLQETLEFERVKFARRWGLEMREDKENNYPRREIRSPRKKAGPYARQTIIHDYWRARKICETSKKSTSSSSEPTNTLQPQQNDNAKPAECV